MFIYFVIVSVVLPISINIYPYYDQKEWDIDINLDIIYDICIYIYIWVNYNDLIVLPHWKSWLVREIIPIHGRTCPDL